MKGVWKDLCEIWCKLCDNLFWMCLVHYKKWDKKRCVLQINKTNTKMQ